MVTLFLRDCSKDLKMNIIIKCLKKNATVTEIMRATETIHTIPITTAAMPIESLPVFLIAVIG